MTSDTSYPTKINKEELEAKVHALNIELGMLQQDLEDIQRGIGELFYRFGDALKPLIDDYYSSPTTIINESGTDPETMRGNDTVSLDSGDEIK